MGIFCEINLCTPADGMYTYQPGSIISGGIRYYLQEESDFTSIIVSLKGQGDIYLEDKVAKRRDRIYKHRDEELYVDIDTVVYTNEKGPLPEGQYETQFSFQLPYDIPGSINFEKNTIEYYLHCRIRYYIRIKFERPGLFKLNKRYKKEVNVISSPIPRMTTEPLIHGEQKSLIQLTKLFSSKKSVVNVKAIIANSALRPGELVRVDYEINNDTNKTIKDVQVTMTEVDLYTPGGKEVKINTPIDGAAFAYDAIPGGETANFSMELMVPDHCSSFDKCKFFSRDYSIVTIVRLPDPHINLPLEIPFQVINGSFNAVQLEEDLYTEVSPSYEYARVDPPTYWEAMGEENKDSLDEEEMKKDTKESEKPDD